MQSRKVLILLMVIFKRFSKHVIDLTIVSVFVDDEEFFHIILDGLPSEYDSFSSAIRTRSDV